MEKGENAGYQHFLLFPQPAFSPFPTKFSKAFFSSSDHFGPRHCTISANLSRIAHENMTYGPKWPVKILDGAKFYPDCAEIKNKIFQFSIQACREKLSGVNIYTPQPALFYLN